MRYRAFRRKKDNLFYFQFLTDGGDVLLNSQAYQDKDTCFNGIRSVITNAGDEGRYEKSIDGDSKHFFILKAGNGQEIGRSSKYEREGDLDNAISAFIADGPSASSKATSEEEEEESSSSQSSDPNYKQSSRGNDDYRPLAYYESNISGNENGFDEFSADDEHYFTYNLAGKVVLISEGYKTDKSRDNGIASVTKNLPLAERYQKQVHTNGKHYFNLRAGNNQEIATSRWFDSEEALDSAIGLLQAGGTPSTGGLVAAGLMPASDGDKLYKDYKPLGFYEENIAGTEFGYDLFAKDDAHYFSVNHDGKPVLISEDYTSEAGRDNGIASVKKNVKNENRYVRMVHPNGMHYFNLLAGNKQEIATSRWFESKKEMEKAIYWLTNTGGTRRRKKATREKKPAAERRYIKQDQTYLCNNITYDTFQSGGNQKYYFVFKDKDGKAVLINGDVRGFTTEEDLEAGIKAVMKFGPKEDKYEVRTTKNGKTYYYIQNEEGKNVARSSLFYDSEEAMKKAMALIQCVGATMVGASAATEAQSEKVVDDYLPCDRYKADGSGFHKFQDEASGEYYFSYNDNEGGVLLRSEGYTTEAARDNGIASVEKNAPLEERWTKGTALNDKYHYYALKAGNHQEIARSCYHDEEAAMLAAFALTGKMFAPEPEPVAAAEAPKVEAEVDDYLPCQSYAGEAGFHTFTNEDNGEHYFAYNRSSDGKTLLRSEGYTQTAARDNGIQSVLKNSPIVERWDTGTALNDKYHYYFLKAGNHQEIARSCYYDDRAAMMVDLGWIKGGDSPIGAGSALVGGTMLSAGMIRLKAEEAAAAKAAEAARLAAEAKAKADAEAAAKAKAEEDARLAAEAEAARKKAAEEKAAAAALAAAAAATAAKQKLEAEAAAKAEQTRLAAEAEAARIKLAKEEKAKAAALAAAAAAATAAATAKKEEAAAAAAAYANTDGGGTSGCMKWLIPALIALALLAFLLYYFDACAGCNKKPVVDPTPDPVETPIDTSTESEPDPVPYGKTGEEMGYKAGTLEYLMANHLSGYDSSFPSGSFDADAVTFSRNSSRLNSAARKQMDNVIALLKEYPDARIDIYGYLTDNESGSGNKEVSLDDDRAKAIYNYLKRGGIDESRMNFQGDGIGDRRSAKIRILAR